MVKSQVLAALDGQRVSWFHFKAIIIAGMGFFNDSYDLFTIGLLTKLIGRIYYTPRCPMNTICPKSFYGKKPGALPINQNSAITAVALCGTLVGQIFFGWLGDKIGRKTAYGVTLVTMVVFGVGQAMSFGTTATAVVTTLCICRFMLGVGIGGDYPLSAVIMSEYANKKTRGAFVAAVFSMQGIGILVGAAITLAVTAGLRHSHPRPPFSQDPYGSIGLPASDFAWRLVLALGAIPAALTFYYRLQLPETARYTSIVAGDAAGTAANMARVLETDFTAEDAAIEGGAKLQGAYDPATVETYTFAQGWAMPRHVPPSQQNWGWFMRWHGWHLIGTTSTWFFLDVAFYSQNLFQSNVFSIIGWVPKNTTMSGLTEAYKLARAQALVALWSTVPGYYFTVFTVDIIGRWWIQVGGFFFMTLFMAILAGDYNNLKTKKGPFVALYSLTFFFANWGPNATTFIVPAEIFPAKFRSTAHGISAACGKAGAIVGAFGFLYASQDKDPKVSAPYPAGIGLQNALIVLTVANAMGLICTIFFVPESKGMSLEDFEGEAEVKPARSNGETKV
jgi:PHS family inorganic phosphate transporter-like MFS transporter